MMNDLEMLVHSRMSLLILHFNSDKYCMEEKQIHNARERKPDLLLQIAATSDFIFLRYIGYPRMEVNTSFLDRWAWELSQWIEEGLTVYVFCHCPFEVHSPSICSTLYNKVRDLISIPLYPGIPINPKVIQNKHACFSWLTMD